MRTLQPLDLEYFLEICRCGSLAQAANQLGITQPALSKSLRRLEQSAGAQLLDRTPRGIVPTQMGEYLMERASIILSELETTRNTLREMSGVQSGLVSVGVAPTLTHRFIPHLTQIALRQRPGLRFRIGEGLFQNLLPQLQLGEFDFIISSPPASPALGADFACTPLGQNLFVACVGAQHPLAARGDIPDDALDEYPWVLVSPRGVLRSVLNTLFSERGRQAPASTIETSSTALTKALLRQQDFIAFLPLEVFAAEEQAGSIVRLPLPWLAWHRKLSIISREFRSLSPAAQFFMDLVREQASHQTIR